MTPFTSSPALGLARSAWFLRTLSLYKARRHQSPHPRGWLDDGLWAECSAEVGL